MTDRKYTGKSPSDFNFKAIRYEKENGCATITFNRPEVLNAINHQSLTELSIAIKDVSWDDSIAVLVLTGEGERAFCTGADLNEQKQFLQRPRDYWKWNLKIKIVWSLGSIRLKWQLLGKIWIPLPKVAIRS